MSSFRPEEMLMLLASYSEPTASEVEEAQHAADAVTDWEYFRRIVEHNETVPLVYHNLAKMGLADALPLKVLSAMHEQSDAVTARSDARIEITKRVLASFAEREIPVVLLKGSFFALEVYKNVGYKKMSDVDVLVRKRDLDGVYEIYADHRLRSEAELTAGGPRAQERFSHHWPPFASPDGVFVVGTHWGLTNPRRRYRLDVEDMWARASEIDFYGVPAFALSPEDNLHHLAVHLHYYKTGVRELADIYNLIRHYRASLHWPMLAAQVKAAGTAEPVYHALSLVRRLVEEPALDRLIREIYPYVGRWYRRDVERKVRSVRRLLWSRSVHLDVIEESYTEFGRTQDPRTRRRLYRTAMRALLWPPIDQALLLNSAARSPLSMAVARVSAPVRLLRVLRDELSDSVVWSILLRTSIAIALESTGVGRRWLKKRYAQS